MPRPGEPDADRDASKDVTMVSFDDGSADATGVSFDDGSGDATSVTSDDGARCSALPDVGYVCTQGHVADGGYQECVCTSLCDGATAFTECRDVVLGPLPPPELLG